MLTRLVVTILSSTVAVGVLCFGLDAPAMSVGRMPDNAFAAKSYPEKKEKKKKSKVKAGVKSQKGNVRGFMSALKRRSLNGDEKNTRFGQNSSKQKVSTEDRDQAIDECLVRADPSLCMGSDDLANSGMLTGPLAQAMAVTLVTELQLPTPTPNFGPNPNNNEWKMLAVGYPIWMWTEGPTTMSTSASASGFTFQMTARWKSTTFHMGDGNTVTCSSMEKYSSSVKPGTPSPNCGYAYSKPSLPKGKYQVRAVADWDVTWSVAGFSGVLPAYNEASASIPIGELVALNR